VATVLSNWNSQHPELDPLPFPRKLNDSELMEALEHAAPEDWKAELKKQHITTFTSLNAMTWRYRDIQDAGEDLAKSDKHGQDEPWQSEDGSQPPRNRRSRTRKRKTGDKQRGSGSPSENDQNGKGSPSNKKHRRNNGDRNKRNGRDSCKHCGERHNSSKDCWELLEIKDKHPEWWRATDKKDQSNGKSKRGKGNNHEKTAKLEQSNKIQLSKKAFARLVRYAKRGREQNAHDWDNSEEETESVRDTLAYYENMRKSHGTISSDSDSL
jgi:hypothetical protein